MANLESVRKAFDDLLNVRNTVQEYSNEIYTADSDLLYGKHQLEDISDGARIKYWVEDTEGIRYLYKQSKINTFGEYTYEHISEYLVKRICDMISVPCVTILIGSTGILSKVMWKENLQSFVELSDEFSHSFHLSNLSTFNISTLLNEKSNPYCKNIVQMLLLDALVGNSDRHPGNFMYNSELGFYPLFDNGSSLCAYVRDVQVSEILKDSNRFRALNTSKSKPVLRDNQKLTHEQLVLILKERYPLEYFKFKSNSLNLELDKLFDGLTLSEEHICIVRKFLEYRLCWFM